MNDSNHREPDREHTGKPGILQVLQSVLGAAFGVQSSRRREQDFRHGSAGVYIAAGVVFTVVFVLAVVVVVRMVLAKAGV